MSSSVASTNEARESGSGESGGEGETDWKNHQANHYRRDGDCLRPLAGLGIRGADLEQAR